VSNNLSVVRRSTSKKWSITTKVTSRMCFGILLPAVATGGQGDINNG
jgi:hypothetical protein